MVENFQRTIISEIFYCDSGMIPWLIVWGYFQKVVVHSPSLFYQLIKFPSSGELNFNVSNPDYCLKKIKAIFAPKALLVDFTDGVSMTFAEWRFNIRKSSTEPLVRLNLKYGVIQIF